MHISTISANIYNDGLIALNRTFITDFMHSRRLAFEGTHRKKVSVTNMSAKFDSIIYCCCFQQYIVTIIEQIIIVVCRQLAINRQDVTSINRVVMTSIEILLYSPTLSKDNNTTINVTMFAVDFII